MACIEFWFSWVDDCVGAIGALADVAAALAELIPGADMLEEVPGTLTDKIPFTCLNPKAMVLATAMILAIAAAGPKGP